MSENWGDKSDGSLSTREQRLIARAARAKWNVKPETLDTLREKLHQSAELVTEPKDVARLAETVDRLLNTDLSIDKFEDTQERLDAGLPTEGVLRVVIEPHERSSLQSPPQTDRLPEGG